LIAHDLFGLPSPAEALNEHKDGRLGFAQAGKPVSTPDHVRGVLFRIMP
jgi:hypothetical protein